MACPPKNDQFISHLKKVGKKRQQSFAIAIPAVTALWHYINIDVYKSDCGIV